MSTRRPARAGMVVRLPIRGAHLADASAWSKARNDPELAEAFNDAARQGFIVTCDLIALELLRSAQNHDRFDRQAGLLASLDSCPVGVAEIGRAREVQAELAAKGQHRGVRPADLLIAAAAESADLPVLHYDHDFDLIAEITGQQVLWIAAHGTLA